MASRDTNKIDRIANTRVFDVLGPERVGRGRRDAGLLLTAFPLQARSVVCGLPQTLRSLFLAGPWA